MKPDFSGYATKAGLECSDGRTIMPDAFKEMDGQKVPLVWQHGHSDPKNILGHAVLEAREDGVYAMGFFNDTPSAQNAKQLVEHDDIRALSIYANKLKERSGRVFHGIIREVSLVLSGANPGAMIDNIGIAHSDGSIEELDDEAIIYSGEALEHAEGDDDDEGDDDGDEGTTAKSIYDSFSEDEKSVVHYMIGAALAAAGNGKSVKQSGITDDGDISHEEGTQEMNVFDQDKDKGTPSHTISHADMEGIVADAMKLGSMKEAVADYALQHNIDDIEVLFPDAKVVGGATPEWVTRRMEWVTGVLNGTVHTPFSRIKTRSADITHEEARAKGYIKGSMKKEEFFGVAQRVTTPTTVYKKQGLERDDMIDITDFDVVAWLKAEMRVMLDEEIARAVLVGDGRDVADEDKVKDPMGAPEGAGIRSILHDHELYVTTVTVPAPTAGDYEDVAEAILRAKRHYKGSGSPTFYSDNPTVVEMLLTKDDFGRRLWKDKTELSNALMVKNIVEVEPMEDYPEVLGIIVNLRDYALGADKGGQVAMFDDFDIDFNKYKYLIETRVSGALTRIKSAIVVKAAGATDTLVAPAAPTFDGPTSTVTIPTDAEVDYTLDGADVADGSTHVLEEGQWAVVSAQAADGFYLAENASTQWRFRGVDTN